jgi:hypothetical protein
MVTEGRYGMVPGTCFFLSNIDSREKFSILNVVLTNMFNFKIFGNKKI